MPRKTVVEMTCDRCGRVWYPEVKKEEPDPVTSSAAVIFKDEQGKIVVEETYGILCESCSKTVRNYLTSVSKDLKKRSPRRAKKDEEVEASPSKPPVTESRQRP